MKILGVIPARGGSKRIPGKNIKDFCGLPLIAWTIQTALQADFGPVVVSSDSDDINAVAIKHSAVVPFKRSAELAQDTSDVASAILELVTFYEERGEFYDAILLLQPTSPFRSVSSIHRAIALFKDANGESVISVSPACVRPQWLKFVDQAGVLLAYDSEFDASLQSQQLPSVFQLNGLIYLSSVKNLKEKKSFYSAQPRALEIYSGKEAMDIDTPFDWKLAEAMVSIGEEL